MVALHQMDSSDKGGKWLGFIYTLKIEPRGLLKDYV